MVFSNFQILKTRKSIRSLKYDEPGNFWRVVIKNSLVQTLSSFHFSFIRVTSQQQQVRLSKLSENSYQLREMIILQWQTARLPSLPSLCRRCQLIFLSYQSPAQPSMHRIPGSLNGPNKAIAKHLEIFRSDTDTTLALHMAAFWTNYGMTHC